MARRNAYASAMARRQHPAATRAVVGAVPGKGVNQGALATKRAALAVAANARRPAPKPVMPSNNKPRPVGPVPARAPGKPAYEVNKPAFNKPKAPVPSNPPARAPIVVAKPGAVARPGNAATGGHTGAPTVAANQRATGVQGWKGGKGWFATPNGANGWAFINEQGNIDWNAKAPSNPKTQQIANPLKAKGAVPIMPGAAAPAPGGGGGGAPAAPAAPAANMTMQQFIDSVLGATSSSTDPTTQALRNQMVPMLQQLYNQRFGTNGGLAGNVMTPGALNSISNAILQTFGGLTQQQAELMALTGPMGAQQYRNYFDQIEKWRTGSASGLASNLADRGFVGSSGMYDTGLAGIGTDYTKQLNDLSNSYGQGRIQTLQQGVGSALNGLNMDIYGAITQAMNDQYASMPAVA